MNDNLDFIIKPLSINIIKNIFIIKKKGDDVK